MLRLLPPSLSLLRGVLCCANQTPKMAHANISTQTPNYKNTQTYERTKEEKAKRTIKFLCSSLLFLLFVSRIPYFPFLRSSSESAGQTGKRQQQAAQTRARRTEKEKSPCPVLPHVCVCVCVCVSQLILPPPHKNGQRGRKVLIVLIMCTVRLNAVFICVWGRVPFKLFAVIAT